MLFRKKARTANFENVAQSFNTAYNIDVNTNTFGWLQQTLNNYIY